MVSQYDTFTSVFQACIRTCRLITIMLCDAMPEQCQGLRFLMLCTMYIICFKYNFLNFLNLKTLYVLSLEFRYIIVLFIYV